MTIFGIYLLGAIMTITIGVLATIADTKKSDSDFIIFNLEDIAIGLMIALFSWIGVILELCYLFSVHKKTPIIKIKTKKHVSSVNKD